MKFKQLVFSIRNLATFTHIYIKHCIVKKLNEIIIVNCNVRRKEAILLLLSKWSKYRIPVQFLRHVTKNLPWSAVPNYRGPQSADV